MEQSIHDEIQRSGQTADPTQAQPLAERSYYVIKAHRDPSIRGGRKRHTLRPEAPVRGALDPLPRLQRARIPRAGLAATGPGPEGPAEPGPVEPQPVAAGGDLQRKRPAAVGHRQGP